MKCKVCRGHAVVDVRRHNAAFCGDHFVDHVRAQVARAIKEFRMFEPEERLLVAVSGGKDSLALWEILLELGYDATGFYLDLGIGSYSTRSKEAATTFAEQIGASLVVRSLSGEHGYTVPDLARLTRRVPCSGCGLNKRYELNRAALEGGFNVLVTGHNLDDEVATLFGNVLHWNVDMLARQAPVLDERMLDPPDAARRVLVKKVKPLVRVAERETAAYAVLRGIDYVVEECPMVEGNTHHRLKEAMTMLEEASPGTKQQFLFGFFKNASRRFHEADSEDPLVACANCGGPTVEWERGDQAVCSFCKTKSLVEARRHQPSPPRRPHRRVR
ncbi:MAG TPA: ATP-binding protein [Actinomycetota bacterium]|nr:ATP-binding protein [Actinomycetota bacterium]